MQSITSLSRLITALTLLAYYGIYISIQVRALSSGQQNKGGFFGQVIENIKQEFDKNKEMKENLKKFREEAQKLEDSDALKKARKKFVRLTLAYQ